MQIKHRISSHAILCLLTVFLTCSAIPLPTVADNAGLDNAPEELRDRMIFLGESTTAHLRSRGVLRGGTATDQVWSPVGGTMMLDSRILSAKIVYPETGEELTVAEAVGRKKPEILVLSFGLNGITGFLSDPDLYVGNYRKLIRAVKDASPDTKIILQTVYPVAKEQPDWKFTRTPEEINAGIRQLNEWLPGIAGEDPDVFLADTASVLPDADGYLRADYSEDGIHLTVSAYEAILEYLRVQVPEILAKRG